MIQNVYLTRLDVSSSWGVIDTLYIRLQTSFVRKGRTQREVVIGLQGRFSVVVRECIMIATISLCVSGIEWSAGPEKNSNSAPVKPQVPRKG